MNPAAVSLVILAGEGDSTRMLYHALAAEFRVAAVILERPVPKAEFLKRRVKKLGAATVAGQILFQALMVPCLRGAARKRIGQIRSESGLVDGPIPEDLIVRVPSANAAEAHEALRRLSPSIVVVNGTRILSARTLASVPARFINMHAGITPLFRGVHGGYWALRTGRPEACGVTVHAVDTGIDTGGILAQGIIKPTAADNFLTYPVLQLAEGLVHLKRVLGRIVAAAPLEIPPVPGGVSRLWSHPTLFQYLSGRLAGIK